MTKKIVKIQMLYSLAFHDSRNYDSCGGTIQYKRASDVRVRVTLTQGSSDLGRFSGGLSTFATTKRVRLTTSRGRRYKELRTRPLPDVVLEDLTDEISSRSRNLTTPTSGTYVWLLKIFDGHDFCGLLKKKVCNYFYISVGRSTELSVW